MGEVKFFYHDAGKHLPNPIFQTGRRIVTDATWVAAEGWQMLGDMPRGKNIQYGLQNIVWHMQDAVWGVQEKIDVVRDRLQQQSVRRRERRAYLTLSQIAHTHIPLPELAFRLQRDDLAVLSPEMRQNFMQQMAFRRLQGGDAEEAAVAQLILASARQRER